MYEVRVNSGIIYGAINRFPTLKEARKAISAWVKEEKRAYGKRVNPLWADRAIGTMAPGDRLTLHMGKQGYHHWSWISLHTV